MALQNMNNSSSTCTYQYTVNGTTMVSLVSVASPELIVTWKPVDVDNGYSGVNNVPIGHL